MFRIGQEEIDAVTRVINSKKLFKVNDGERAVYNFEQNMKKYLGAKHFFALTSGHAALVSIITALGIGPGDEVIVPAYTYVATAHAVLQCGAIPVVADINDSLTLDAKAAEKKISKYTKAIIPVHMQGMPCDMDAIMALAKKYNLYVIEDACQGIGGSYKGKKLSTIGDAGAFSFQQAKNITAGEGGAVITNSSEIFERAYIYHDSNGIVFFDDALDSFNEETFAGSEYRMNELSGAVLGEQLKRLNGIIKDLKSVKARLLDAVADTKITMAPSNDADGDCGTLFPMRFESAELAHKFSDALPFPSTTLDTMGRHIYTEWESVLNKKGAFHPLMNPYNMEANKNLHTDMTPDECQKTLDILSSTVIFSINPDWSKEEIQKRIDGLRKTADEIL